MRRFTVRHLLLIALALAAAAGVAMLLSPPPAAGQGVARPVRAPALIDIRAYGAKSGDPAFDNIAKINLAGLAAFNAGGGAVYTPAGTWTIKPTSNTGYVRLYSGVSYVADGPEACWQVAADAGDYQAVAWDAGAGVSRCSVRGLRIDQNAAGNTTARVQAGVANTPQFAIYASGVATDLVVRNVQFDTCTGVNTVWAAGGPGNRHLRVDGCYFNYKKTPGTTSVDDNSAIYLGGKNLFVTNTHVYSGAYANCPGGGIELHGAPAVCTANLVDGYQVGTWGTSQFFSADQDVNSDITITGNTYSRVAAGVRLLAITSAQNASPFLRNVTVAGNTIGILQAGTHHDAKLSAGVSVQLAEAAATIDGVTIADNRICFEPDSRTNSTRWGQALDASGLWAGIYATVQNPGATNVVIDNNRILNAPGVGMYLGSNAATSVLGRFAVTRNRITDAGRNANLATRAGFVLTGVPTDSKFDDNEVLDTSTTGTPNGQYAWQVFPAAAATRSSFRRNVATLAGSGAFSYYYDLSAATLLGGPSEGTQSVPYAASITPDPLKGTTIYVGTLTGNITVNAVPTAVPSFNTLALKGQRLRFIFTEDATGGRTITFNSAYRKNWSPDTSPTKINVIEFEGDGSNWYQTGAATGL